MIDTIKIYTEISKDTFEKIYNCSIVKMALDNNSNEKIYEITNDHLCGSYDSRLSVRVGCGIKYGFCSRNGGYYLEIEGSYHKWVLGYNSHNGYCDLQFICENLISHISIIYDINLPDICFWYLQRCDIAITYDLHTQENVIKYINSLSRCTYPRRNVKFFYDESLYLSGTTTTLKIYNKMLEFRKHDLKKFIGSKFNLDEYLSTIDGFIRFECEIKKKMLLKIFGNENIKHIKIIDVKYEDLRKVWSDEFMKLLKFIDNDLEIVRGREEVLKRLQTLYSPRLVNILYNFYCSIQLNGLKDVQAFMSNSTFYRNLKYLKEAKIDFSQSYKVEEIEVFHFNPFEYKEVA